jgi:hypothetical protein
MNQNEEVERQRKRERESVAQRQERYSLALPSGIISAVDLATICNPSLGRGGRTPIMAGSTVEINQEAGGFTARSCSLM